MRNCLLWTTKPAQRVSPVGLSFRVRRMEPQGLLEVLNCLFGTADAQQRDAEVVVRHPTVGISFQSGFVERENITVHPALVPRETGEQHEEYRAARSSRSRPARKRDAQSGTSRGE